MNVMNDEICYWFLSIKSLKICWLYRILTLNSFYTGTASAKGSGSKTSADADSESNGKEITQYFYGIRKWFKVYMCNHNIFVIDWLVLAMV